MPSVANPEGHAKLGLEALVGCAAHGRLPFVLRSIPPQTLIITLLGPVIDRVE